MKAAPFEYQRVQSIAEACAALQQYGDAAKLVAGGQSLVPMMAFRLARPRLLVDINEVPELRFIAAEPERVRVGAGTRQCAAERDDGLAASVPLVRQALAWVGHIQTRNRGTLGGSLAHADPTAELPLAAQVLGATLKIRASGGARALTAAQFFIGAMTTALAPTECLEEIAWPIWPERRTGSAFTEISIRHGDFALVAAAAQVALDDGGACVRATFGLGGVGQTPMAFPQVAERLVGSGLQDDLVRDVAHEAARRIDPPSDVHATAPYRRHLAAVLTARALKAARDRASAKS